MSCVYFYSQIVRMMIARGGGAAVTRNESRGGRYCTIGIKSNENKKPQPELGDAILVGVSVTCKEVRDI